MVLERKASSEYLKADWLSKPSHPGSFTFKRYTIKLFNVFLTPRPGGH